MKYESYDSETRKVIEALRKETSDAASSKREMEKTINQLQESLKNSQSQAKEPSLDIHDLKKEMKNLKDSINQMSVGQNFAPRSDVQSSRLSSSDSAESSIERIIKKTKRKSNKSKLKSTWWEQPKAPKIVEESELSEFVSEDDSQKWMALDRIKQRYVGSSLTEMLKWAAVQQDTSQTESDVPTKQSSQSFGGRDIVPENRQFVQSQSM